MKKKEKLELLYCKSLEVFARYGYKKTTLDDIAGEIGITKPGLYKYVKDKMDLYEKTLSFALLRWQDRVVNAVNREDDIVRKFIVMSQKGYDYLMEDELLTEILRKDPTIFPFSTNIIRFKEVNQRSLNLIKYILEEGIKQRKFSKVDIQRTSVLLYSIYRTFIVEAYVISDAKQIKKIYTDGINLILNGLIER
ncbi:MAG TPA: TetR/AcrR family transcriptional regulator [Deltaproteobacteria bacterium]|jgi:AcrR family transcriptional regulator|nr:TetR/AcrR family transcriptional regulator [Spirochaetia bacterium]HQG31067.1 TetR/AcrR family transcriptional regulator [Deltaproteobacteria bacterium]HQJ07539.1 TetR/AcrR family transcriptional regulator [Deltaproteobacteria bacterium]